MTNPFETAIAASLADRRARHLYRTRKTLQSPQGACVNIEGKNYISFCSNDYLGLANHPDVVKALKNAADQLGVGSGAAHLISGHSASHHALENELAEFVGFPRALLFSTGFMANIGTVTALVNKGDAVFEDRLNHASLIDAGLHSGAQFQRYLHADTQSLQQHLEKSTAHKHLIVTDGVFSMDGDIAPADKLASLARQHNAWLMVDDAHGLGVLGKQGRGTLELFNLTVDDVPVYMATLGKALGTFGAFVAGSNELIEYLIHFARSYSYTTALPPALAEATRTALSIARKDNWRREKLRSLVTLFRQGAEQIGLSLMDSSSPIQPVILGQNEKALRASSTLFENGFLVSAVRPPTVPDGTARLRITFSAAHEEQQVIRLLDTLEKLN